MVYIIIAICMNSIASCRQCFSKAVEHLSQFWLFFLFQLHRHGHAGKACERTTDHRVLAMQVIMTTTVQDL